MLFNSYIFVLLFLPACLAGYYMFHHIGKHRLAQCYLLAMSLWFYGYFNVNYLAVILSSIAVNYAVYRLLKRNFGQRLRKAVFLLAVAFNIGILFYFKYYDFFIENINSLFHADFHLKALLLPLGISFFTFQQLSFVIDAYRGQVPDYGPLEYMLFVTYFPQLIAGPIVTHDELVPQFQDPSRWRIDWKNFCCGAYIFAMGMAKKVLLADTFGRAVSWGFGDIGSLNSINAFLVMLSYTFQIYFDFSGYCDMAVGIGKMMNIDLPVNFNSPYKALTITEFWDRWHITLTRFFTKYVYIPLGGRRKGKYRTYLNVMIVFLLSGIWHGANWTFILWGVIHGLFSVVTRHFDRFFRKLPPAVSWLLTFGFINAAWLFFRADTIHDALRIGKRIVRFDLGGLSPDLAGCFSLKEFALPIEAAAGLLNMSGLKAVYPSLLMFGFFAAAFFAVLRMDNSYEKMQRFVPTPVRSLITVFLMLWCVCSFSGISTFLYFNF